MKAVFGLRWVNKKVAFILMVCAFGRGRMAAMVRLLANGNYPEMTAEEASHEKLAAQSVHRELHEADEANLLEEEDMHVFDCKPMADPLHLVCCNTCRKPVKASQYAAHAELCRSLNSREETYFEVDGGMGHKKPPRKGRKKLQTANESQTTLVGEQERSGSIEGNNIVAAELNVDDHTGMTLFPREAKRNSTSLDGDSLLDGSLVSPRSQNYYPSGVMSPSEKRTKLIAAQGLETDCHITTTIGLNCQEALTYFPVPLATKMYHLQRNLRLRTALSHLYQEASTKEHQSDSQSSKVVEMNEKLPAQISSPSNLLRRSHAVGLQQKKKDQCTSPGVHKPDQILAQSSELCLGNTGGYSSAMNFSNQFRDNNLTRPALSVDTASMGMMKNRYLPPAYSFPGNSGTSLGTMQQPNGSVPVV